MIHPKLDLFHKENVHQGLRMHEAFLILNIWQ